MPHRRPIDAAPDFVRRHIGPSPQDIAVMLKTAGAGSLDQLMAETLPYAIRHREPLRLGAPLTETKPLSACMSMS